MESAQYVIGQYLFNCTLGSFENLLKAQMLLQG